MSRVSPTWRIFLTCWLIYCMHFASNTVREIYPALSLGEDFSFRVDDYAGLHPDLFEKPGYGWHINSNPGASMLAAIPYAVASPVVNKVVERVNQGRKGLDPPPYNSPWENDHVFYEQAWSRGFDVKFGLAAIVTQMLCMAPLSAFAVVGMFAALRRLQLQETHAVLLALLFAFGTPVFYRTATLNHNMLLGHLAFAGFLFLWNPGRLVNWTESRRIFAAGAAAGAGVLMDYSGVIFLGTLGLYALYKHRSLQTIVTYTLGALGPLCLLLWAQWRSFGNPIFPAQHWMPATEYTGLGMDGVSLPALDLMLQNLFDYRFGLFTSAPIFLLALGAVWMRRRMRIPTPELMFVFGSAIALWLFSSSVQFGRLQFNSGVRYMAPAFALLFLPAAMALLRLPIVLQGLVAVAAIAQAWSMAMYRDVERGLGLLEPILHVFTGGFQLPFFTVLTRMSGQYGEYFQQGASPLPLFFLMAAVLYVVWRPFIQQARSSTGMATPAGTETQYE